VTIHIQEPFKKVLGVPDLMMLYLIIPIGYPPSSRRKACGGRWKRSCITTTTTTSNSMSNERVVQYLYELRGNTMQS
jgi:hypothetical protein